jgi:hypothetical protein
MAAGFDGDRRAMPLDAGLTPAAYVTRIFGGLGMLAFCAFAYAWTPGGLLRYGATLVLGWLGLQVLWSVAVEYSSGPVVRMDSLGIRHALLGHVRWQDVAGIAIDRASGRQGRSLFLNLGLMPGADAVGAGFAQRTFNAHGTYRFSLQGLDHSPVQILQHAIALRDQVEPPRLRSWYPGMSEQVLVAALRQERDAARLQAASGADGHDSIVESAAGGQALAASSLALGRALRAEESADRRTLGRWSLAILLLGMLVFALRLFSHYLRTHG